MRRVLVAGSRTPDFSKLSLAGQRAFNDLCDRCYKYVQELGPHALVVTGGACGIDAIAETAAREAMIHCAVVKVPAPAWRKVGKRAGLIRDNIMLSMVSEVAIFRYNKSKGTTYVMECAKTSDKLVHVDDVEAR